MEGGGVGRKGGELRDKKERNIGKDLTLYHIGASLA